MKRRNFSQIQSKDQIPDTADYAEERNKKYEYLTPTYIHESMCKECGADSSMPIKDQFIHINDIYKYDAAEYHRDNYCVIPVSIPSMSLNSTVYSLDQDVVSAGVPKISKMFGLEYDYTFILDIQANGVGLSDIAVAASDEFAENIPKGSCKCRDKYEEDVCTGDKCYILESPLDHVVVDVPDISDEYAYIWEDIWDMSTISPHSGRYRRPKDESSSSSTQITAGAVYLCKIVNPPTGNGGTATVEVISVSGSGAVKTGQSIVVNVPAI